MENQSLSNEVRSKIDIVDLISETVPLKEKGKGKFWGLCPFHNDTNESLYVNRDTQTYRCWSCAAAGKEFSHGNVFTFYQWKNNCSFKEALYDLAKRAGITVKGQTVTKTNTKLDKYYEIYDLATKYFELNLVSEKGKEAVEYLSKRGIDKDVIKEFHIGLALNDKDRLIKYFKAQKIDINTLNNYGLANNDVDTFINRVMFPLDDRFGKTVAFSGRIYEKSDLPKYINTKDVEGLFKKGDCLYHYKASKEEVAKKKYAIVMEGFMDVIRASTIGVRNTVALMGVALSNEHIELLKKLSLNIYLCLDGDEPGQNAMVHNGELLEKAGFTVKIICLKDDEDPDSFILKYGKEKFETLIEDAVDYNDFRIQRLKKDVNFNSDEEVTKYAYKVLNEIVKIKDNLLRSKKLKNLEKETELSYNTLEKKLMELEGNSKEEEKLQVVRENKKKNKYEKASLEFIYYMLVNERAIKIYDSKKLYFINSDLRSLAAEISYYYHSYGNIVIADFYTYLSDKKELLTSYEQVINQELSDEVKEDTLLEYSKVISDYNVGVEIKRLENEMKKEPDELEKARIANKILMLRIGGENNE